MRAIAQLGSRTRSGRVQALVFSVAVAATWAPGAHAATADWAPPVTVSTGHDSIGESELIPGKTGDLLAWNHSDRASGDSGRSAEGASYAIAATNGIFGPEQRLSDGFQPGPLVDLGGGRAAQLIYAGKGDLKISIGDVRGKFSKPRTITSEVWGPSATVAGNERGDLAVAWLTSPQTSHRDVWVSVQPAGGRFGAPQRLAARTDGSVAAVAMGASGDVAVAYDTKQGRLLARTRIGRRGPCQSTNPSGCSIAGRAWGTPQDIGPAARVTSNQITPYVGPDGRVTVAWLQRQLSEGGAGPARVNVAVRPAGVRRFLKAQTLFRDPDPLGWTGQPVVVANRGGGRVIAFTASAPAPAAGTDSISVIKVAYSQRDRFGVPQTLSPAGQNAGHMAAAEGPRGAIITWVAGQTESSLIGNVFAAVTDPSRHRFGAPQQVAATDRAFSSVVKYSPNGDRWLVAWAAMQDGAPKPAVVRTSFCRLACQ